VGVRVRGRHAGTARAGFPIGPAGAAPLDRFTPDHVETTDEPLHEGAWDAIWLCVASPALQQGDWLERLCRDAGDSAVVVLQPGLHDRALVMDLVGEDRLVRGMIPFSSWPGPLPGSEGEPGLRWWCPPFAKAALEGPRAAPLAAALRRGGLPAAVVRSGRVDAQLGLAGGVMQPLVASLEGAEWSFELLRRRGMALTAEAAREAISVSAAVRGGAAPWWTPLVRAPALSLLTRLAQSFAPFDFEAFLRVHFTKVGDQTRGSLESLSAEAAARGLPRGALTMLRAELG
jgi:2-dehydropantoate 2-reductase